MDRKPFNEILIFLAAAAGLAGGFFIGKREGAKPAQIHRALSTTLQRELQESRSQLEELQLACSETADELSETRVDADECRNQFNQLVELQEAQNFVGPIWPMLPASRGNQILTQQRVEALEREIASLKELVSGNGVGAAAGGALVQAVQTSAPPAKAGQIQLAKVQCSATTKKGVRCSRTARSDGKCWQHGG